MIDAQTISKLREEVRDPRSWHWVSLQKGMRNSLLRWSKSVQGIVSVDGQHVSFVLDELARMERTREFVDLWSYLSRLHGEFLVGGDLEAANAVRQTLDEYAKAAQARFGRRWAVITIALGTAGIAMGLHEGPQEKLSPAHPDPADDIYWPEYAKKAEGPSFVKGDALRDRAILSSMRAWAPHVRRIIEEFDKTPGMTLTEVKRQTAFYFSMSAKNLLDSDLTEGEAFLLPVGEEGRALVICNYHSIRDKLDHYKEVYVHPSIISPGDRTYIVLPHVIAYSSECDIALCYASGEPAKIDKGKYGPAKLNLKVPTFSTHCEKGEDVYILTNAFKTKMRSECIDLPAHVVHPGRSWITLDARSGPGYSGAVILSRRGIVGILQGGKKKIFMNQAGEKIALELTIATSSRHVKQLLEFFLASL